MSLWLPGQRATADRLNLPGCEYRNTGTTQSFTGGTMNKFSYPTAIKTFAGIVASGTNNTDFTVQTGWDGWYIIDAGGRLGNTSVGCYFAIRRGTTEIKGHNPQFAQTFHVASVTCGAKYLAAGDSINFGGNPTGAITTAPAGELQTFAMKYLGQGQ